MGIVAGDFSGRGVIDLFIANDGFPNFHFVNRTPSARDAIGATVTLHCGARTSSRQVTAGEGYIASNERRLVFGIGEQERIDELRIRWPGGQRQQIRIDQR